MTELVEQTGTGDGDWTVAGVERVFLIADVRGYTRFTREQGDSAAVRLAGRFAELARDAVEARNGRVVELRGDEALAVFESAAQAVRAARELAAVCADEAAADEALPLLVGAGIDLGKAVPFEGGFRGAALNTASRLCSQATVGQVLVTPGVAERAGEISGIRFAPGGSLDLKGFDEPVAIAEALDETERSPVARPAEPGALPLELEPDTAIAGRESELAWLRGTWRQVARGRGRIIILSGAAGIGKSRLAAELAGFASASGASVSYAGAGGTAAATASAELRGTLERAELSLLVLDDLDATADALPAQLVAAREAVEDRPTLILCLARDPDRTPELERLLSLVNTRGDGHRRLDPLGADAIRTIAAGYAPIDMESVPLESIARASGGVPAKVHELMSEWARQEATRRLEAAAEFLAAERRHRSADLAFANNAIGLKLGQLYAADAAVVLEYGQAPYKGLASFEELDAALFFGREQLVGELAARTVGTGLLAVVGASGSGKSSVIAAGLIPSLRTGLLPGSDRWASSTIRPGEHPLAELRAADVTGAERIVLVVDQFEELFTLCSDEEERTAFVDRLVGLASDADRHVIVIGLRGDYYGHCGTYPDLAQLVAANQVLVGPMSPDELRRAIELPGRRARVRVESALTDALVEEIGDEPGGLPLLSTALAELWRARDDEWLRVETYERLGGVRGAVARLAEGSYENLSEDERDASRRLFLRLVASGDEGALARRRVPLEELDLDRDPALAGVVERLTADRLLTAQGNSVEVAHEALLREWPRFHEWLAEDAQGRELREHLTQGAKRWDDSGRDGAELYRGARLSATLEWAAGRDRELNELERAFLAESRSESELEATRQRRQNRRLRALVAGLAFLLLVGIAASVFAFVQRSQAQTSATSAEAQRLGAQSLVQNNLDLSLLLAREGVNLTDSAATRGNLLAALLRSPNAIGVMRPVQGRLASIAISRDGRELMVGSNQGRYALIDPATRRVFRTFSTNVGGMNPSGSRIGLLALDGQVEFMDATTGETTSVAGQLPSAAVSNSSSVPTFSPDLRLIAVGINQGPHQQPGMLVFSTSPLRLLQRFPLTRGSPPYPTESFSPDGRYLMAPVHGGTVVWRIGHKGARIIRGPAGTSGMSQDDRLLAVGGSDGSVTVYDLRTGNRRTFNGRHDGFIDGVVFSPDDRTLVTTGDDGRVLVWDVASGTLRQTLSGHHGRVWGAAFSADGKTLYTSGNDSSVIVWDLAGTRTLGRPFTADGGANPQAAKLMAVSPDGRLLAFGQDNGKVILRNARTLRKVGTLNTGGTVNVLAFSPDSRMLATESHGGSLSNCTGAITLLWTLRSPSHPAVLATPAAALERAKLLPGLPGPRCADFEAFAFNPAGTLLAGASDTGDTVIWQTATHRVDGPTFIAPGGAWAAGVDFSPDGKLLATTWGSDASVWRLADRKLLYTVNVDDGAGGARPVVFSPDGRLLATGGASEVVKFWNAQSGKSSGRAINQANDCPVNALQFTHDGKTLLVGGCDGAARLYDVATRTEIGSPLQGPTTVQTNTAGFSADGKDVFVAYDSGQAYRWNVEPDDWRTLACSIAGRNMTHDEWDQFLPDRGYAKVCTSVPAAG